MAYVSSCFIRREVIPTATGIGELFVTFRSNAKEFGKELLGLGKQTTEVGKGLEGAAGKGNDVSKSFSGATKTAKNFLNVLSPIKLSSVGVALAFAKITNESIKLEKSLDETNTILQVSDSRLDKFRNSINNLSVDVGKSSVELSKGLYETVSAGQEVENSFQFLTTASKLSTVGFTNVSSSVDLLTSIMNAYGDEVGSVEEVSRKLLESQNKGKLTISQLTGELAKATSQGANLGVSLDDILGGLITITKQGFSAGVATTQLRRLFVEFSDSGSDLSETFKKLTGESFRDYIKHGGDLQEATKLIGDYAARTGKEITDFTGRIEAGTALIALSGKNADEYARQIDNVRNTTVDLDSETKKVLDNVAGEWSKLLKTIQTEYDDVYNMFIKKPLTITLRTVRELIGGNYAQKKTTGAKITTGILTAPGKAISKITGEESLTSKLIAEKIQENLQKELNQINLKNLFETGELDYYKQSIEETDKALEKASEKLKNFYEGLNKTAEISGRSTAVSGDLETSYLDVIQKKFKLTSDQVQAVADEVDRMGFELLAQDFDSIKTVIKELDFKTPIQAAYDSQKEMEKTAKEAKKIDFEDFINKSKEIGVSLPNITKAEETYQKALAGNKTALDSIQGVIKEVLPIYKEYKQALEEQANQLYFNATINKQIEDMQQESANHQLQIYESLFNNSEKYLSQVNKNVNKYLNDGNLTQKEKNAMGELYSQFTQQISTGDVKGAKKTAKNIDDLTNSSDELSKKNIQLISDANDLSSAFINLGNTVNSDFLSGMGSIVGSAAGIAGGLSTASTATTALGSAAGALGAASAAIGLATTLFSSDSQIYGGIDESQYESQEEATETFKNAVEEFAETVSNMDFSKITEFMKYTQQAATLSTLGITSNYESLYKKKLGIKYKVGSKTVESANIAQIQSYLESQGVLMTANEIKSLVDKYTQVDASGTSQHAYIDKESLLAEINNLVEAVQDQLRLEIAENLNISDTDISSNIIEAVDSNSVKQALQEQFYEAAKTAMLQAFGLTDLYKEFAKGMVNEVINGIAGSNLDTDLLEYYTENLTNYSFEKQLEIISKYTNEAYKLFEELQIKIDQTTSEIVEDMDISKQINIAALNLPNISDAYDIGFENVWNQFVGWLPDARKTLEKYGWTGDLLDYLNIDISEAFNTGDTFEKTRKELLKLLSDVQDQLKDQLIEAFNLTQTDVSSTVISGFSDGDVKSALMNQYSNAMQQAMLQSFGMADLYKAFGENVYKQIIQNVAGADFDFSVDDLSGLTLEEQAELIAEYTDKLAEYMEQLGVSLDTNTNSTDSLNSTLSTSNLPEGSKLAARIFDVSEGVGTVVTNQAGNQVYYDFSGADFSGSGVTEETVKKIMVETVGPRSLN